CLDEPPPYLTCCGRGRLGIDLHGALGEREPVGAPLLGGHHVVIVRRAAGDLPDAGLGGQRCAVVGRSVDGIGAPGGRVRRERARLLLVVPDRKRRVGYPPTVGDRRLSAGGAEG